MFVAPEAGPGWVGKRVVLRQPGKGDKPEVLGEVWLDAQGKVQTGLKQLLTTWEKDGIVGRGDKGRLYPRDGQRFLDELPFMYKSPYLWAEPKR